ncbi:hypothetical protein Nepgr_000529 [Nepenthes gracilis]|uniref:Pentatricopeptide repeat-containing protein n=1 Tax=Nepenthes gracilis TaxID=150966 RepID=A0AAD3P4M2_NEPGR|nr:hypothetical protein Nepgr_000529 [Nepenthes gracilis]
MPQSPEHLLRLLQRFIKHLNQIKQIQTLTIISGHLHFNPVDTSKFRWMSTLLFNALIRAYLNVGQPYQAIFLFTRMLDYGAPPNNFTFPSLIKAASSLPSSTSVVGRSLHTHAIKCGVSLDPFIQTSFINFFARFGSLSDAQKVFEEMSEPCIVSCNAMLDVFGKYGDMGLAMLLFGSMRKRDVFSWTSMINGFGSNGCYGDAIRCFEKMMAHEDVIRGIVRPNEATFVSVLSSCAYSAGERALYQGKQVHGYIVKNEIELTVFTGTALISVYGKLGCLTNAMKVFNQMKCKQVCTWNALISSLASNGKEKQATDMLERMKKQEIWPNEVTFVALLSACSRAKYVDLGLELFRSMSQDFDVVPRMEHYGCVVDLLGRAGLLREAEDFIKSMPFEPDDTVLGALMGACKVHGATELGNEVGRRLLKLQPWHCGRYVALSTINAWAERWGHAADLRKDMTAAGIQKIPACSLVHSL